MKHLFIINPAAGKKDSTKALEKLLAQQEFEYEVVYTKAAGDARRITERAVQEGQPLRVYACGGDGTLNEVVNGAAGHDHVAVTNVPKGTGNDFLKIFGPNYREEFYDLKALSEGPQSAMDLIECNGLLGIDVVCAGIDARIGAGVHYYKNLRFVSGMGAYVLSLLENVLLRGLHQHMRVRMGDIELDSGVTVLAVCNGRHYGGGFQPVPEAMPDDGVLDALLIPKIGWLTFLNYVGKYAKGQYKKCPKYIWPYHGDRVSISAPEDITVVVDGEQMRGREFEIFLSEKKVNFFYPATSSYEVRGEREEESRKLALNI